MQDVGEGQRRGNQSAGGKAEGDWHNKPISTVSHPSWQDSSTARSGSEAISEGQVSSPHAGRKSSGRLSEERNAPRGTAEGSARGTAGNRGGDGRRDGRRDGRSRGPEKQPERGQRPGDAGQRGRGQESNHGSGQIATHQDGDAGKPMGDTPQGAVGTVRTQQGATSAPGNAWSVDRPISAVRADLSSLLC